MKHKHSGVYYATRQAVRAVFVAGLLLTLALYLAWAVEHTAAAITIGTLSTTLIIGCAWFHWSERAVALIRRRNHG